MADQQQQVNISELSLEQLSSLKQQFESELSQFSNSFSGLKQAQLRFQESNVALQTLAQQNKKRLQSPEAPVKKSLIPLTASIYVPATLAANDTVLVDVGTGYYIDQSVSKAQEFMTRKIEFLEENTQSIQTIVEQKRKQLEQVIQIMQYKMQMANQAATPATPAQ